MIGSALIVNRWLRENKAPTPNIVLANSLLSLIAMTMSGFGDYVAALDLKHLKKACRRSTATGPSRAALVGSLALGDLDTTRPMDPGRS